jgi:hypothetical protein
MTKLSHEDLYGLEEYARIRPEFRAKVMQHKVNRRVPIGDHATLYFEDELTMKYQVQEMLRLERIFEPEIIQEELDVYNPLIPDGSNWKATFMVEYEDENERKLALSKLIGIESRLWIQVDGFDKVYPIANEDLDRETEDKTSSVHFVRFELSPEMVTAAKSGSSVSMGIEHDAYNHYVENIPAEVKQSLIADLH